MSFVNKKRPTHIHNTNCNTDERKNNKFKYNTNLIHALLLCMGKDN